MSLQPAIGEERVTVGRPGLSQHDPLVRFAGGKRVLPGQGSGLFDDFAIAHCAGAGHKLGRIETLERHVRIGCQDVGDQLVGSIAYGQQLLGASVAIAQQRCRQTDDGRHTLVDIWSTQCRAEETFSYAIPVALRLLRDPGGLKGA